MKASPKWPALNQVQIESFCYNLVQSGAVSWPPSVASSGHPAGTLRVSHGDPNIEMDSTRPGGLQLIMQCTKGPVRSGLVSGYLLRVRLCCNAPPPESSESLESIHSLAFRAGLLRDPCSLDRGDQAAEAFPLFYPALQKPDVFCLDSIFERFDHCFARLSLGRCDGGSTPMP